MKAQIQITGEKTNLDLSKEVLDVFSSGNKTKKNKSTTKDDVKNVRPTEKASFNTS